MRKIITSLFFLSVIVSCDDGKKSTSETVDLPFLKNETRKVFPSDLIVKIERANHYKSMIESALVDFGGNVVINNYQNRFFDWDRSFYVSGVDRKMIPGMISEIQLKQKEFDVEKILCFFECPIDRVESSFRIKKFYIEKDGFSELNSYE